MQQAFFPGEDLHESAEFQDGNDLAVIDLADLGNSADVLDPFIGFLHRFRIVRRDVHDALAIHLVDVDDGSGFGLDLLDDFAALADDGSDEVFRDLEGDNPGYEGFVVFARSVDRLHHFAHDVHSAFMCLRESLFEHFVGKSVHLDVHLGRRDSVLGPGHLEVHVPEVIFVTEDVRQDRVAVVGTGRIGDESHRDTGHRFADLHTCVHEGEAASADGSLGRRTVGFEDVGYHTYGVREFGSFRHDSLEGAHGKIAMADFSASHAPL